jgi:signal transduction histidine kinase/CheY-like chemotaxis protein/HPt (histidine-containing phosphotransfer) domain-containing protein
MYSNSIFESFFAAQGYALFENLGDGNFRQIGGWPSWCEGIWGAPPKGERIIRLGDKSPFLENFLFEAGEFWSSKTQGSLNSGNWMENGSAARDTPLEASAHLLDGKQILIVRNLSETFAQQQAWFQTARDSLLQHEKLIKEIQKKEILLHCIVHDLTQPLSAMHGVFHLLEREALPATLKKYVKAGERESQRQELMIRGILEAFSSDLAAQQAKDATTTEVPDLLACAKQAIEEFSTAFRERGVRLRLESRTDASRDWHVVGDASRLDRIFGNLLENAMRYTPKASTVAIGFQDQGDFALAFVDDEGPGLPQGQNVDQLFALFSKGKTHAGKAGLGLYFCKITVERWGGTIGAETREQGGSRFWFRLPRARKSATPEAAAVPAEKSPRKETAREGGKAEKPLHILVADDAELNRDLVIELLHKRGHSAEGVADGRSALAAIERRNFDVVLMDEEMPRMTGLEATKAVRQREAGSGKHQIIVGLSGHAAEEDEIRFRDAGMDAYLAKPVHMDKLYEAVESAAQSWQKSAAGRGASQPEQSAASPPAAPQDSSSERTALADRAEDSDDVAAHLRRTTGGNEKLIRSLARTFLTDAPKTLALIRAAVTKKDAAKLARAAHLLKGSLAIFGAPKAVAAARNLEAVGRNGNLTEASNALRSLESEFALLQQKLRTIESPPKSNAKRKSRPRAQVRTHSRPNR